MASTYRLGPSPVAVGPPTSAVVTSPKVGKWRGGDEEDEDEEDEEGPTYRLSWLLAATSRRRPHAEMGRGMGRNRASAFTFCNVC